MALFWLTLQLTHLDNHGGWESGVPSWVHLPTIEAKSTGSQKTQPLFKIGNFLETFGKELVSLALPVAPFLLEPCS